MISAPGDPVPGVHMGGGKSGPAREAFGPPHRRENGGAGPSRPHGPGHCQQAPVTGRRLWPRPPVHHPPFLTSPAADEINDPAKRSGGDPAFRATPGSNRPPALCVAPDGTGTPACRCQSCGHGSFDLPVIMVHARQFWQCPAIFRSVSAIVMQLGERLSWPGAQTRSGQGRILPAPGGAQCTPHQDRTPEHSGRISPLCWSGCGIPARGVLSTREEPRPLWLHRRARSGPAFGRCDHWLV